MSSKYDQTASIHREEEGSYHRHERTCEPLPAPPSKQSYTQSYQVVKVKPPSSRHHDRAGDSSDNDNFDEWTTSKRKVNHKTRQVETRVSRQLLVEDGKVIADSGPQVTTRIKEDNKVEECEKEKAPKNKSKFDDIENAPEGESISGRVLGEKKEIKRVSREVREENMQYHDERFKELTGQDVHRRAIQAPHELITITDKKSQSAPRGKMVHYSNKGKKFQDTDEILEVAKLAIDGSITKEVKRTKHHEEVSEDEKPDEKGEADALRRKPIVERSSRRHVDYVNDFDDISPTRSDGGRAHESTRHRSHRDDEAFPRYEIDPLLNSLKDEDYIKPSYKSERSHAAGRYIEHPLIKKDRSDSSETEREARSYHRHRGHRTGAPRGSVSPQSPSRSPQVEIPEVYRVNKQRLLSGKGAKSPTRAHHERERSFSPANKSHLSHRSSKSHRSQKEDASVQAHLTDEEEERKSFESASSSANSHEKTTRHLQRQSTANSSRNYYFGESRRRSPSLSSASSSSLSDPKERLRKQGARSRDSGFKSPHSMRTPSGHKQQEIYSVSDKTKQKNRRDKDRIGAASPAPTTGSLGQRSVKTTTTTMSAGLTDRPRSRNERSPPSPPARQPKSAKSKQRVDKADSNLMRTQTFDNYRTRNNGSGHFGVEDARRSLDSVSISSLGPNATTIKVPYKQVVGPKLVDVSTTTTMKNPDGEIKYQDDTGNRSANIKRHTITVERDEAKRRANESNDRLEHFDYRTIIANVQPAPIIPKQNIVDAYNVRVIEHNSPLLNQQQQPIKSVSELSNSIARLELLSSGLGSSASQGNGSDIANANNFILENNNEPNFNLTDYAKHKAVPVLVDSGQLDDDGISLMSSGSMRSTRTYDIRTTGGADEQQSFNEDDLNDEKHFPVGTLDLYEHNDDDKKPAAWVFDIRDGSSTAIVAPPKPKKPESPKIETEELGESRGGRSYYLELLETNKNKEPSQRQRPCSIDSFYSRWNSQSALNTNCRYDQPPQQRQSTPTKSPLPLMSANTRKSRQIKPPSILDSNSRPIVSNSTKAKPINNAVQRRQLPFSGPPLSNRSKSSSCLTGSIRPSKYSIYGGLKQANGDNKPVPRLSYSRAIGPKSQRQIDAQSKTPSRYLKLK